MQGIVLLLPGEGGAIPGARELREAGFTLSTALAPAGGAPEAAGCGAAARFNEQRADEDRGGSPCGPSCCGEKGEIPSETYANPARRMTSTHISDRLKG